MGTDVHFKVYGDDATGVMLYCWDCRWQQEWSEGVDLKELDKAAATHHWEVHAPLREEAVRRLSESLDVPREMLE
jgi:hypothetical protein